MPAFHLDSGCRATQNSIRFGAHFAECAAISSPSGCYVGHEGTANSGAQEIPGPQFQRLLRGFALGRTTGGTRVAVAVLPEVGPRSAGMAVRHPRWSGETPCPYPS